MPDEPRSEPPAKRSILAEALGSDVVTRDRVTLYLPNRDRNGELIADYDSYIKIAIDVMTELNRGATTLNVRGAWRSEAGEEPFDEDTALIYSLIFNSERFVGGMRKLVKFVCEFGEKTRQDEVLVEYNDEAYLVEILISQKANPEPERDPPAKSSKHHLLQTHHI